MCALIFKQEKIQDDREIFFKVHHHKGIHIFVISMVAVITIYEWHPSIRVRCDTLQNTSNTKKKLRKQSDGQNQFEVHELINGTLK